MRNSGILIAGLFFCVLALAGCGGGGSGGGTSPDTPGGGQQPPPTTQTTIINGTVSKGLVSGATVTAFKIVSGVKSDAIVSGTTGSDGTYSLDLGTYTGPVLLEMSGGSYTDEATGAAATIPSSAPLRAVVASASGTMPVAITPLTELACRLAGTSLTSASITSANKTVSDIFKVYDIIATQPAAPTATALAALPATIQGQDRRDYTLVLATFSQIAKSQNISVSDTISYLLANISSNAITPAAAAVLQSAAATYFSAANAYNATGVTDPANTKIVTIGARKAIVKLAVQGTVPTGRSIKGISFEVNLPAGVSVRSDANGVLSSYLSLSGGAPTNSTMLVANATGSKIIVSVADSSKTDSIPLGEFATLTCDVAYNAANPAASNFSITSPNVIDLGGSLNTVSVIISGVTVQ